MHSARHFFLWFTDLSIFPSKCKQNEHKKSRKMIENGMIEITGWQPCGGCRTTSATLFESAGETISWKFVAARVACPVTCEIVSQCDRRFKGILFCTDLSDTMTKDFRVPVKEISSLADMKKWEDSEAYHEYVGFILAMNEAVRGKKISDVSITSETVKKMVEMLDTVDQWINEIPPIEQPQRFGNKAFRTFYSKLKEESESLLKLVLPEELHPAVAEIAVYLTESVGNSTRIDYGTGHEMFFAMLLCCLFKIGAFKQEESDQVILKIFDRYLTLMRKLQVTYRMEPAGSHGVWSLDDYQFLPFIWGSSQLIGHPRLEPRSFPDIDIAETFAKDYMFMGCIKFINQVKSGPFSEHSNQLWNISGVPNWEKVNSGLIKMYKKEVLGKHPVIQHVLFGSLLPITKHENLSSLRP